MSVTFLEAAAQRHADCIAALPAAGDATAALPPRMLSTIGGDLHGEICAACSVVTLARLRRVAKGWTALATGELSRRLALLPPALTMSLDERVRLVETHLRHAFIYEALEAWCLVGRRWSKHANIPGLRWRPAPRTAADDTVLTWAELEPVLRAIGLMVPWTLKTARLPGTIATRALARARHLDAYLFEDVALLFAASLHDYDGEVCALCESIWSPVPDWNDFECRLHGLCVFFADAAGVQRGDDPVGAPAVRRAAQCVLERDLGLHVTRPQLEAVLGRLGLGEDGSREWCPASEVQELFEAYAVGDWTA